MVHSILCFGVKLQPSANKSTSSKNKERDAGLPSNFGAALLFRPGMDFTITAGTSTMAGFEFDVIGSGSGVGVRGIPSGHENAFRISVSDIRDEVSSSSFVVISETGEVDLYSSESDVVGKLSSETVPGDWA